jgi:hypothetical protein
VLEVTASAASIEVITLVVLFYPRLKCGDVTQSYRTRPPG